MSAIFHRDINTAAVLLLKRYRGLKHAGLRVLVILLLFFFTCVNQRSFVRGREGFFFSLPDPACMSRLAMLRGDDADIVRRVLTVLPVLCRARQPSPTPSGRVSALKAWTKWCVPLFIYFFPPSAFARVPRSDAVMERGDDDDGAFVL